MAVDAALSGLTTDEPALGRRRGARPPALRGTDRPLAGRRGGGRAARRPHGRRALLHAAPGHRGRARLPRHRHHPGLLPETRKGHRRADQPRRGRRGAGRAWPGPCRSRCRYHPAPSVHVGLALRGARHRQRPTTVQQRPHAAHRPMPPGGNGGGGGGVLNRVLMTVVVLLVIAAVGVGAWTIGRSLGNPGTPRGASPRRTPAACRAAQPRRRQAGRGERLRPPRRPGGEGRARAAHHRRQAQHVLEDRQLQQRRPGQSQGRSGPAPRYGQVHADQRRGRYSGRRARRAASSSRSATRPSCRH